MNRQYLLLVVLVACLLGCGTFHPPIYDRCELIREITYPDRAEIKGIEGNVDAQVHVNQYGYPTSVEILSADDPMLADAVRMGILHAHCYPAMNGSTPTSGTLNLLIRFEMSPISIDEPLNRTPDVFIRAGFGKIFDPASDTIPPVASRPDSLLDPTMELEPTFDIEALYCFLEYPEVARRNNIEGNVIIRAFINRFGQPARVLVDSSSNPVLDETAMNALRKIRFRPAVMHGKPVPVWLDIPINFRLRE